MGASLSANDLEIEKAKPLSDKLKTMAFPLLFQQSEILNRLFGKAKSLSLSDLIYQACILIYELKNIMLYDYHQKRLVYSFYSNLAFLPEEVKGTIKDKLSLKIIPLDLEITVFITQKMLLSWWNKKQTIKDIFNSPATLSLYIKQINKEVKQAFLKQDTKLIIYGGQPLDDKEKRDMSVVLGRKMVTNNPKIAFSPEETYISKKQCVINYAESSFFIVDYSKKMFTAFQIENKPYLLQKGMVIQLSLTHRFFIDELSPEVEISQDEEDKILRMKQLKKLNNKDHEIGTPYVIETKQNNKELGLRFIDGDLMNNKFSFKSLNLITIGRSKKNNIQILNKNVSKYHCQIYFNERFGWLIQENLVTKSFEYPPSLGGTQVLLKNYDEIQNKIENSKEWVLQKDIVLAVGKTLFSIDME